MVSLLLLLLPRCLRHLALLVIGSRSLRRRERLGCWQAAGGGPNAPCAALGPAWLAVEG